jgi:hypothetical protein
MVKLYLCLIKHQITKVYEGMEVQIHAFLISVLRKGENSASRCDHIVPMGKIPCYPQDKLHGAHSQPGSFGEEKNLLPLKEVKPRFLCCPTHSLLTILSLLYTAI